MPSNTGTETGRLLGVRGWGRPVDTANSAGGAPTDDRRVERRKAELEAADVEMLDLIGLAPGKALGGGPRPIDRWAELDVGREYEAEGEALARVFISELGGRGIIDGEIGRSRSPPVRDCGRTDWERFEMPARLGVRCGRRVVDLLSGLTPPLVEPVKGEGIPGLAGKRLEVDF